MSVYLKRYAANQRTQRWGAAPWERAYPTEFGRYLLTTWVRYHFHQIRDARRRRLARRPPRIVRLP